MLTKSRAYVNKNRDSFKHVVIPCSPCSDTESSIASCSDLVAALEALTIELQQEKERQLSESKAEEDEELHTSIENETAEPTREHTPIIRTGSGLGTTGREEGKAGGLVGAGRQSPVKSLTLTHTDSTKSMIEKEKILNECMNQIKVCWWQKFKMLP